MVEENGQISVIDSVLLQKINSKLITTQRQHKAKDCWSKGTNSRVHKAQAMQQRESKESPEILQGQEASACVMNLIKESSDKQIELAGGKMIPVVSAACQDFEEGKRGKLFVRTDAGHRRQS